MNAGQSIKSRSTLIAQEIMIGQYSENHLARHKCFNRMFPGILNRPEKNSMHLVGPEVRIFGKQNHE